MNERKAPFPLGRCRPLPKGIVRRSDQILDPSARPPRVGCKAYLLHVWCLFIPSVLCNSSTREKEAQNGWVMCLTWLGPVAQEPKLFFPPPHAICGLSGNGGLCFPKVTRKICS